MSAKIVKATLVGVTTIGKLYVLIHDTYADLVIIKDGKIVLSLIEDPDKLQTLEFIGSSIPSEDRNSLLWPGLDETNSEIMLKAVKGMHILQQKVDQMCNLKDIPEWEGLNIVEPILSDQGYAILVTDVQESLRRYLEESFMKRLRELSDDDRARSVINKGGENEVPSS